MEDYAAANLWMAIENLINVKLHDALARRDGLDRLVAHRSTGVASPAIRQAEAQLQDAIAGVVPARPMSRICLR